MQFQLYAKVANNESITSILGEPPAIVAERKTLNNTLLTLKQAIRVLRRDPE